MSVESTIAALVCLWCALRIHYINRREDIGW